MNLREAVRGTSGAAIAFALILAASCKPKPSPEAAPPDSGAPQGSAPSGARTAPPKTGASELPSVVASPGPVPSGASSMFDEVFEPDEILKSKVHSVVGGREDEAPSEEGTEVVLRNVDVRVRNGPMIPFRGKSMMRRRVPLLDGGIASDTELEDPGYYVWLAWEHQSARNVRTAEWVACRVGEKSFVYLASGMAGASKRRPAPTHREAWAEVRLTAAPSYCEVRLLQIVGPGGGSALRDGARVCYEAGRGVRDGSCPAGSPRAEPTSAPAITVDALRIVAKLQLPPFDRATAKSRLSSDDVRDVPPGTKVITAVRADVTSASRLSPETSLSVRYRCGDAPPRTQRLRSGTTMLPRRTTEVLLEGFPEGFEPGRAEGGRTCTLDFFTGVSGASGEAQGSEVNVASWCLRFPSDLRPGVCGG